MKNLASLSSSFTGNVLCLGVKEFSIIHALEKNKKANTFLIEQLPQRKLFSKRKKAKLTQKGKKINMKKLRKTFKKKSVDYIICDLNEIYDYFKYFIYDSVVINKKELYLYGSSKLLNPQILGNRFKRFHAEVTVETDGDEFLIIVNNQNSKGNILKAKWYVIVDTFHNLGDMISAALIS